MSNLDPVQLDEHLALRVAAGRATPIEALATAAIVVSLLNDAVKAAASADLSSIGREEARALLDAIEERRTSSIKCCVELALYPVARRIVQSALTVAAYAEGLLVPALLMGNADAKSQRSRQMGDV